MLPDIYQLLYFRETARALNFTRAAEKLYISRQALTKSIRRTEQLLGEPLFIQNGRQLSLTPFGEYLLQVSAPLLSEWEKFSDNLEKRQDGARPVLQLTVGHGTLLTLPPKALHAFHRTYPQYLVVSDETSQDGVAAQVLSGEAEVGLIGSHPSYLNDFDYLPLKKIGMYLMMRCDHPLAEHACLTAGDLAGHPIAGAGRHNHQQRWLVEQCSREGVQPYFTSSATYSASPDPDTLDPSALYFSFSEEMMPAHDGWLIREVRLPESREFGTYVIHRKHHALTAQAITFIRFIRDLTLKAERRTDDTGTGAS